MIKTDCSVLEYSVYADTDHHPGRYVFFLETNKSMTKDKNEEYLDVLQKKLYKANPIYEMMRENTSLSKAVLHFVEP